MNLGQSGTEACACLDTSRSRFANKNNLSRINRFRLFVREFASPCKLSTGKSEAMFRPHAHCAEAYALGEIPRPHHQKKKKRVLVKRIRFDTSGAYRASGILPARRCARGFCKSVVSDPIKNPSGKRVGESAIRRSTRRITQDIHLSWIFELRVL